MHPQKTLYSSKISHDYASSMGHLEFSAKKVSKNEDLILKNSRATTNDR